MASAKASKRTAVNGRRPRGKNAVMDAVLNAATALFSQYGSGSVSVRDIARTAGINHALLHRHFGSKRAVLEAVLERSVRQLAGIASEIVDARSGARQLFLSSTTQSFYRRILARSMLDGTDIEKFLPGFPIIERLINVLERQQSYSRSDEIRFRVACVSALVTGWSLFEPLFLRATGLSRRRKKDIEERLIEVVQGLLEKPVGQVLLPNNGVNAQSHCGSIGDRRTRWQGRATACVMNTKSTDE
jgi:AcrR family transcriptional regulator